MQTESNTTRGGEAVVAIFGGAAIALVVGLLAAQLPYHATFVALPTWFGAMWLIWRKLGNPS